MIELGKILTLEYGKPLKEENRNGGEYPVFGSNGVVGYHSEFLVEGPFIVVGRKGTVGAVTYSEKSGYPIDTTFFIKLIDKEKVNLKYLYSIMHTLDLDKTNIQAGVPGLNRNDAYKVRIPLPSIDIQGQMIVDVEEQERIINSNKKLIEIMENKIDTILKKI